MTENDGRRKKNCTHPDRAKLVNSEMMTSENMASCLEKLGPAAAAGFNPLSSGDPNSKGNSKPRSASGLYTGQRATQNDVTSGPNRRQDCDK